MTDLDRKIAELKGLRIATMYGDSSSGLIWMETETFPGSGSFERHIPWSKSDAKAFELVDEMESQFPPYHFQLARLPDPNGWRGKFTMDVGDKMMAPRKYTGQGNTRAEAICRAYIALKEWEGKK